MLLSRKSPGLLHYDFFTLGLPLDQTSNLSAAILPSNNSYFQRLWNIHLLFSHICLLCCSQGQMLKFFSPHLTLRSVPLQRLTSDVIHTRWRVLLFRNLPFPQTPSLGSFSTLQSTGKVLLLQAVMSSQIRGVNLNSLLFSP